MELENQNEERKVVTAEEFLGLLSEKNEFEGFRVDDYLSLEDSKVPNSISQLVLKNCSFKSIELDNYESRIQLVLDNCTVQHLSISRYDKESSSIFGLYVRNNSEIQKVTFFGHSSIQDVDISESTIGYFEAINCSFLSINCKKVIFKDRLSILASKLDAAKFNKCSLQREFSFLGAIVTTLSFRKCLFEAEFLFALDQELSTDIQQLRINIESCKANDRMVFSGINTPIDQLRFHKHTGLLEIHDLIVLSVEIHGSFGKEGIYHFNNCAFHQFDCTRINSPLKLTTIKSFGGQSEFIIRTSDLNDTSLFDVNFQSFDSITIEKTDFTNMSTSRVTWFDDNQLQTAYQSEYEDPYERREFYRQLKYNQEKQGNKIQALEFQSLEMKYYSQELAPKHAIANVLLRNKFVAFFGQFLLAFTSQNRFILWIGKSNNHGQSFLKPLLFLIVLGLIFNFLILWSASPQSAMELLFKKGNLQMLPSLLNPVHDISKLLHVEETSFLTGALDLTWKVVETTLIFQTITAFRKHVRV